MGAWATALAVLLLAPPDPLAAGLEAFHAGRLAEAQARFDALLRAQPDLLPARYWRARTAYAAGAWDAVVADCRRILRCKPDSLPTRLLLADAYDRLGCREAARGAYAAVLAAAPDHAAARQALERLADTPDAAPDYPASYPSGFRGALGPQTRVETTGLEQPFEWLVWTDRLSTSAAQVLDYTFAVAPTDWRPSGGVWAVVNRYACDPSWSFYGGYSAGLASLWNKREFVGDIAVEAYVAFKYGVPGYDSEWLERPADLCLTICGDGVTPASGYSFIFGGDEGSRTMIRRGDQVLAETSDPQHLPPSFSDRRPGVEEFHWRWWWLTARKEGTKLTFQVDGCTALTAVDPEPLEGGHVALWTVRNGIMLARVRIGYESELRATQPVVHQAVSKALPDE